MPVYRFKAVDASGRRVEGEMSADDRPSVIRMLRAQGHWPITAELKGRSLFLARLMRRGKAVRESPRAADVTSFTQELATLLAAGIPINAALGLLHRHASPGRMHTVLKSAQRDVQVGKSLSSALAAHPAAFDPLYLSLIRAGESSGALDTVLTRLAAHREKSEAFRASLVSALAYPSILLGVATISLFVLMAFVVPRFIPLFSEADQMLPRLTRVVFAVSQAFAACWWGILTGGLIAKVVCDRWLARPANRTRLARGALRIPVLGELLKQADVVRFSRTLAMLLRNGLPILSALKLAKDVVRNVAIGAMVVKCLVAVQSGRRLSQALREEALLPSLAIELITIGEESGNVEGMLDRTADTFEARMERQLKRLLTVLEPVLILGLGALIGIVIVAILMAMLGLNELVI